MSWKWNRKFKSPFKRGGCVPTAFATVSARPTAEHAIELANKVPSFDWKTGGAFGCHMFRKSDGSIYTGRVHLWAGLACMKVEEDYVPEYTSEEQEFYRRDRWGYESSVTRRVRKGLPTLARFAREHPKGRWVAFTHDHAVAVINGTIYGAYQTRSRVECAIKVTPWKRKP